MPNEDKRIETYLREGAIVVLHLDPHEKPGPQFRATVRAWHESSDIELEWPEAASLLLDKKKGQPCVVRFVSEDHACAFDSCILAWGEPQKDSYCLITWPEKLQVVPFRRHQRIKVTISCRFKVGDTVHKGEVRDLSIGGCGLCAPVAVPTGARLKLTFVLPDGLPLENVQAIVRDERQMSGQTFMACKFSDNQEHVQGDIAFFVSSAILLERGLEPKDVRFHVLIIDENSAVADDLRRVLEKRGWYVFVASGTIEGLQHLQVARPVALLVSQEQRDLTGLDVARLMKSTHGYEQLPIFVYGADLGIKDKAAQAGVSEYFTRPIDYAALCDAIAAVAHARRP